MILYRLILSALLYSAPLLADPSTKWPVNPNWSLYFKNTQHMNDPHPTLVVALENLRQDGIALGTAVDLGCGAGKDTFFLLQQGWHVYAMDAEEEAIRITTSRATEKEKALLVTSVSPFADFVFPEQVILINATKSLPFCPPGEFPIAWEKITKYLVVGGRFAGQFFGDRDEWASIPNRSHHTYREVLDLLKDHFEIEFFQKEEATFPTAGGMMKKWHIFHVVAKKIR
jgi:tellurite methyltransferase